MSVKERKLSQVDQRILASKALEKNAQSGFSYYCTRAKTWSLMLYYEFLKNDVAIRAESLSYFTLFSLMPLMAGIFFLLSLFSEWTPIQKEFQHLLENFLQAIPEDQRATLMNFIYSFKDEYLAKLSSESRPIGLVAFCVLIWIAGKVFFNLESLINRTWSVRHDRKFFDRIQNFIFCIIIFPLAYVAALSLPRIIRHLGQREFGIFLHQGISIFIFFFSLMFIFRYFPNTKVYWKSAFTGALVSTICISISNFVLGFYFRFGTSTAYGKAAILPIFAFFVYVGWLIFILGLEVSMLAQTEAQFEAKRFPETTLSQALILERIILKLNECLKKSEAPIDRQAFATHLHVSLHDVDTVIGFLQNKKLATVVENARYHGQVQVVLVQELLPDDLIKAIKDFLNLTEISQNFDVSSLLSRIQ
jgi:membrane protein